MNIVWRKDWIHEYESPWSVFEKLALVNLINRNEILYVFGSKKVKKIKQHIGDTHRDLLRLNGFDLEKLHQTLDYKLKEHSDNIIMQLLAPFYDFYGVWDPWFHDDLQWCPQCMEGGFHSWLHQFKLFDTCAFHENKLIDTCPKCMQTIPFLLSNKQLESAFQCKCGHILATLGFSNWNDWKESPQLNQSILSWLEFNMNSVNEQQTKWIVHEQHCNLTLLLQNEPEEIKYFDPIEPIQQDYLYSNLFRKEQQKICSNAFQIVEESLLQEFLGNHQDCITQLIDLRKKDDMSDFPTICPYAYTYVFWRKSLLMEERFYGFNPFNNELISTKAPLLIEEHLEHFTTQLINYQIKMHNSIDRRIILWVLEKLVTQFSENFFDAWFDIAGKGCEEISVPPWKEVIKMRDRAFPNIALKCRTDELGTYVEYHHGENTETTLFNKYECIYQNENIRLNIKEMSSYTPPAVALMLRGNTPDEDKKILQKSIEAYVKKLNF
ncbi:MULTISPECIES: hypothetical protein [Paenibacillus]|uniref:TniQ family protein n=3 Tax=Paenibacillus TaxID=44249 RepID=A0A7Y6BVK7_9BACL|nr:MULTISPECIES: hypothetical protein [Paenibacillus]KGP81921.1 hypothetical protein P364_0113925 [Paenibacillus sp. MAEPY2]KGP87353.1 hypothetical protein P363_0112425 [Paenibacillus sp. MAEPY1]MDN4603834.1 hypothetical protein [Paenibacillus vandeheii]NUU75707.1 hypothetical protein [Paenibacillus xylanilyticus]